MRDVKLANLDLNLLRAFLVIYRVRSTVQAAEELHVSQPAVSHMLTRLRDLFDDPLFIRSQRGFLTTERADRLFNTLPAALESLEAACAMDTQFHPSELTGKCRIALQPLMFAAIADELFLAIHQQAPNLKIELHYWESNTIEMLFSGEMDLGVNDFSQRVSKEIYQEVIYEDKLCALVRRGHPLEGRASLTTKEYLAQPLCSCITTENKHSQTIAEMLGEKFGLDVNMALRSSSLGTAVEVLQKTDFLLGGQEMFKLAYPGKLSTIDVEGYSEMTCPISAYLHQRNRHSARHTWLISLMIELIREKMDDVVIG